MDAAKEREKDAEMPPVNHHPTYSARRRACPWESPDPDQEVAEAVFKMVAKGMRQLPALPAITGDEDSSTEYADKQAARHRRKMLKSGMDQGYYHSEKDRLATSDGKPVSYQDMSVLNLYTDIS